MTYHDHLFISHLVDLLYQEKEAVRQCPQTAQTSKYNEMIQGGPRNQHLLTQLHTLIPTYSANTQSSQEHTWFDSRV